jgi:hypothetical protein
LCLGDVSAASACVVFGPGKDDESEAESEQKVIFALAYMADSSFEAAAKIWDTLLHAARMWMRVIRPCIRRI